MLLEIQERLALVQLLPQEGDYAGIKTLRRAREMIYFTEEEKDRLKFEDKPGGVLLWDVNEGAEMVRDIPIDEWTTNTLGTLLPFPQSPLTSSVFLPYSFLTPLFK